MNMVRALLITLCFVCSCSTAADYSDPISGDSALATSMSAEAYSLGLISAPPTPVSDPEAFGQLVAIANDYQEVAKDAMFFHSLSLRAVLPVPPSDPKKAVNMLPSPSDLAKKAKRFKDHALYLVNRLDSKIDSAYQHGTISGEAYFVLMDTQTSLRDQISTLPTLTP